MADLILVPTAGELNQLQPRMLEKIAGDQVSFQLCGFGLVAAAARASALISRYKPQRVMLVGIAGSYDCKRWPVGTAYHFRDVACDGIGVGTGSNYQSAADMGWKFFDGGDAEPTIGEQLSLDASYVAGIRSAQVLVSCCSASADSNDASRRRERFPGASAEDMEGFAVALSCLLARVPFQVVRGISNSVGDRNKANWKVDEALTAAAKLAVKLLPLEWMPNQA